MSSSSRIKKTTKKKPRSFHFVNYEDGHGSRFKGSNREMRQHVMLDVLARSTDTEEKKQSPGVSGGQQRNRHRLTQEDLDRGRRQDEFGILSKPHPSVDMDHLKQSCVAFFGWEGMTQYGTSRTLRDDLFFKSSIRVTAAREDAFRNRQRGITTPALEANAVGMHRSGYAASMDDCSNSSVESVLNRASTGLYSCNGQDALVNGHYNELGSATVCVDSFGDLENMRKDFPKLILMAVSRSESMLTLALPRKSNALIFAATRELQPHPSFLSAATILTNYVPHGRAHSYVHEGQYNSTPAYGSNTRSWIRVELLQTMRNLVDSLLSRRADSNYYALKDSLRQRFHALPNAEMPGLDSTSDYTYESCRLAVKLLEEAAYSGYSLSNLGTTTESPSQLQSALLRADVDKVRAKFSSILLWMLLIGAAASRYTAQRSWFIAQLMRTALTSTVTQGEVVIATICRFLEVQNALVNSVPWTLQ